ncbi:MAG: hypothetical protein ACYTDW_08650 [Planctomycetota bacterium]|jgi:small conductance mechanosensitive channel
MKKILEEPSPTVAVVELGDSSVNFVVRPWVNADDYFQNGISIPYPQRDIHMKNNSSNQI